MKRYIWIFLIWTRLLAQSDTIYVNENSTVTLLFSDPVTLVDIGTNDFISKFDDNVVLLKATKHSKELTNLFIRYGMNQYFTGFVKYQKQIDQFYFNYQPSPELRPKESGHIDKLDWLLHVPTSKKRIGKRRKNNIVASVTHIRNDQSNTYFRIQIANKSSLPFKIDYVGAVLHTKVWKRGLADQIKDLQIVGQVVPEVIPPYTTLSMGLTIKQYAPKRRSRVKIYIQEFTGSRSFSLHLRSKNISLAPSISDYDLTQNH